MSDSTTIVPETESPPQPDVLVLPAEYFFVERVDVPPALESSELEDFAELSMEAIAPFPLEQLNWGFCIDPSGETILIYAALKERLKRAGYKDLESYTWVLPDFATLQGARFAEAIDVVLYHPNYYTIFRHPGGEALPTDIRSLPNQDDDTAPETGANSIHLQPLPVDLTEKGSPIFRFETVGIEPAGGHWSPLIPDEATVWQADIRPTDFKTIERNARRTTAWVTKLIGLAAYFALFLILLEGLLFVGGLWLGTRTAKIESQANAVRRIEDKQSLMNKLEQVAQNELRPIAILEAANAIRIGLGNTGIEYDETVIEGSNRLTIEGKANTINELNAYTESLRKSGNFQLVDTPKSITRSGKTTFTVTLDYIHREPAAPELTEIDPATDNTPVPETPTETP